MQCIDSWARSQQSQLAALPASSEQIIHRSVVVGAAPPALDHPQTIAPPTLPVGFNLTAAGVLPILPQFALPGTPLLGPSLLPQHLPLSDAALEEEAKRVAAAAARAARQQKRREAKARQETKRKRDDEIAVEAAATAAAAATLPGGVPQLEVQADAGVKPVRPQVPESRGDRSDMRAVRNIVFV